MQQSYACFKWTGHAIPQRPRRGFVALANRTFLQGGQAFAAFATSVAAAVSCR